MAKDPAPPFPTFGALLRRFRLAAGLSQEALAERAGVSARAVSDLERGQRQAPYPHTVHQLARALRLSAADRARLEDARWRQAEEQRSGGAEERRSRGEPATQSSVLSPQSSPPTNLPLAVTSFVGRERELTEVRGLLGTTRLLTLTGAGGVGKTRLALEVAQAVVADYPDGVWLVELAALADPALVPRTVARALGIPEQRGQPHLETLVGACRGRRLLLVLDNCEHLLDACASLADALLRGCPGVRLLATSREALGISGEVSWRVPSLALPDGRRLPPLDHLARYEAVQLFVARAAAARPSFALTPRNAPAVAQLCVRLDGIPLALELAAARVTVLTVEQIAQRLDDRFRLLTEGGRTAPPRQRTLAAAIDWSHDLLTEAERAVFRRLAVFAGGWTLEAAEAVGAGDGLAAADVLGLLSHLVDKSLVQAEAGDEGEARYRLLETVRQYAGEKLREAGEEQAARDRHRDWCLALAERAEPALRGPEQVAWMDRLDAEHDNLRAALAWCLEVGEQDGAQVGAAAIEAGLRLAGAIGWFWFLRVHWDEAVTWYDRLLEGSQGPTTAARAKALCEAGAIWWIQLGNAARGRPMYEESVVLYRALGDPRGLAHALSRLGELLRQWGWDYAGGTARMEEALRLARQTGDQWLLARVLHGVANSANLARPQELALAQAAAEESLRLLQAIGDMQGIAIVQRYHGRVAMIRGDYERARAAFAADLAITRALGDTGGVQMGLNELAAIALAQGDLARAAAGYRESLALWRERVKPPSSCLEGLARVEVAAGRPARAARLMGAADVLWQADARKRRLIDQPVYEAAVAAARAALGEAAFAAAWAEGQAMTREQVIEEALDETDLPPSTATAATTAPEEQ